MIGLRRRLEFDRTRVEREAWVMKRSLVIFGTLFLVGGCGGFPQKPPVIGYDPAPYGDAFRVAATEAVFRDFRGAGFYQAFGDAAYTIGRVGRCTDDGLANFLAGRAACVVAGPADSPICREQAFCLRFTMDRALAENQKAWQAVEAALLDPCTALTSPEGLQYRRWPSAIGKPAQASWALLRCDRSRRVVGSNVQRSDNGAEVIVTLRFGLAGR